MLTADEGFVKHRREFDYRDMNSRLHLGKRHRIESVDCSGDKQEHTLKLRRSTDGSKLVLIATPDRYWASATTRYEPPR